MKNIDLLSTLTFITGENDDTLILPEYKSTLLARMYKSILEGSPARVIDVFISAKNAEGKSEARFIPACVGNMQSAHLLSGCQPVHSL